jgi:hypothetical protein
VNGLKKEEEKNSQERIKQIIEELKSHNITKHDLVLSFLQEEGALSQIFDKNTIETLETITKHLKEIKNLKLKNPQAARYSIPITILSDRTLSALEHVTTYLKEDYNLTYKEIAILLNRDQRTIWTTYQRAIQKKGK